MPISTVSSSGLAVLTQAGTGILSNLPAGLSASELGKASPEDVVELSSAALQAQNVSILFGDQTSSSDGSSAFTGASLAQLEGLLSSGTPAQKADFAATVTQSDESTLFGGSGSSSSLLQSLYQAPNIDIPSLFNTTG